AGDLGPALESHLSKYRKLVPALALINQLADHGRGPISEGALLKALCLAEYLETHARRAYAAGSEAETAAAKAILAHIRSGDIADGFTARDVHQRDWSNLTNSDAVQSGLNLLCELDWLADAFARLQVQRLPIVSPANQERAVKDAGLFLNRWGELAVTFGWSRGELLDVPGAGKPGGLVWFLQGQKVRALGPEHAVTESGR